MTRRKLYAGLFAVGLVALIAFWPPQHAKLPVQHFQPHQRPQHPAEIYYPPGEPEPKVPGDPGYSYR